MVEIENIVIKTLEDWGFFVEKIVETRSKTPDFICEKNGEYYLIELKTRFPNPEERKKKGSILMSGELFAETII